MEKNPEDAVIREILVNHPVHEVVKKPEVQVFFYQSPWSLISPLRIS